MPTTIQKRTIDMDECRRMGIDIHVAGSDVGTRSATQRAEPRDGLRRWPTWGKGVSRFPWSYDVTETCYLIEGRVTVTPQDGTPVEIEAGDLVIFPAGMRCT